jgi:endonuclease-3 related protein
MFKECCFNRQVVDAGLEEAGVDGLESLLMVCYERLLRRYGRQGWWPGESRFEVMVGAILTQRTNWRNAERSIALLKDRGLMDPKALTRVDLGEVEEALKPTGLYREKAVYLKNMASLIVNDFNGDVDGLLRLPSDSLRRILLSVKGVGPETADSIILYAAEKPECVADAYTTRILNRLGLTRERRYDSVKRFLQKALPEKLEVLKEFHALMVRHGKEMCKVKPKCEDCPLNDLCLYFEAGDGEKA